MQDWPDLFFFIVFYPLPGAGTGPIRCVTKNRAIQKYFYASGAPMWYPNLPRENSFLYVKPRNSSGNHIFANPELQSKRKGRATLFAAGYTNYPAEMIFLVLLRATIILLQTTSQAPEHQSVA